jgi:hypothetical protein
VVFKGPGWRVPNAEIKSGTGTSSVPGHKDRTRSRTRDHLVVVSDSRVSNQDHPKSKNGHQTCTFTIQLIKIFLFTENVA